jgi:hypothetical protein
LQHCQRITSYPASLQRRGLVAAYDARPTFQICVLAGVLMLVVLSVMFAFASPYPKRTAWLKGTAVGRVLNDYDW